MLLTITLILVCIVCIGLIFTNQALFDFVIGSIAILIVLALFAGVFGVGAYVFYDKFNSWTMAIFGGLFFDFLVIFFWNGFREHRETVARQKQIRQERLSYLSKQHLYPPKPR